MKYVDSQYLKTSQIAKMFNVSGGVVVKWILQGVLPAIRTPGGHYRILVDDANKLKNIFEVKSDVKSDRDT